jgi:Tfp pilus assembly protein PilN
VVLLVAAASFIQAGLSSADLSGAKNDQVSAQQAVNRYAEVPRLSSQLNEIKSGLTDALAAEVLFSEMIKSVGKTLPSGVSLSSLTFSLAATNSGSSGSGASSAGAPAEAEIGLLSITGTAPSLDSISTFIENLEASEEFDTVTLTSATRSASSSGAGNYTFSGTANMGKGALSGRYAKDGIKSS